jgi:SAM-dependent methyltransferase
VPRWRRAARQSTPLREVFGDVSDDTWFWLNTSGRRRMRSLRSLLPDIPADATQELYTGIAGDGTMRQAWAFWQLVAERSAAHGVKLEPSSRVLDFGCGWGRIIRFFARDSDHRNLSGVDINPSVIEVCRSTNRWSTFAPIDAFPPTELDSESFDVIYAYSVFSHLPEDVTSPWVAEFARLLRPGGLLIVTTRDRGFIQRCQELRTRLGADWRDRIVGGRLQEARAFLDPDAALADYDAGRYCFSHRGGDDPPSFGEACISRAYVEEHWTEHLRIVDFLDDLSRCPQVVIVAQKPGG